MLATTPLVFPQLGALYDALAPMFEALLRFVVGLWLVPHGLRLFYGCFPGTGVDVGSFGRFAAILDGGGYRPGRFWAAAVWGTEFVAGPLLALGLLTRPAALAASVLMIFSVLEHIRDGYFWNRQGVEYPLLWAVAALYFVVRGGGPYSLDNLLGLAF